ADGALLAATRVDTRALPSFPVVRYLSSVPEVDWGHTTRPGGPVGRTEVFLFETKSKKATQVDLAGPLQQISLIRWLPDGSEFLLARADRELKKLELVAANATTGQTRVLLTETQATFVQPPLLTSYQVPLLEGGKRFLWLSERDGWNHIY